MRTNIALLAVLLALCAGYWLMVRSEHQHRIAAVEAKRLFQFAPGDVTTISIRREGERVSTGVRQPDGTWEITEPVAVPASSLIWERVAKNLSELSNERAIEDSPKDLAVYKLNEPRLEVTASTKDGMKVDARFGEMDPTQKFRYAQLGDGLVFLARTDQFYELDRDLTSLRDCELFHEDQEGISYIEFTPMRTKPGTPEGEKPVVEEAVTVIAQKDDSGTWSLLAPEPGTADQEMLKGLASDLQYARGRNYVDTPEDLSDYQLDPPRARVRIRGEKGGELQTAYFGGFEPAKRDDAGVFVMQEGRPSVFVVDEHIVQGFPQSGPNAWREKRIVTRQGSDIVSIKFQAGPQQFLLVNEAEGGWKLKEPQEEDTDQAAVSRFVGDLLEMKGSSAYFERKPEYGLDVPAIRLTLTYKDVETPAEILVGALVQGTDRYYVTQDSGVVTTLEESSVKKLGKSPKDFMSRVMLSFKKSDAQEMKLTLEGTSYTFVRGEQAWKILEPAGKVWESQDDMQALIDAFAGLRAESVDTASAPPDVSVFGLDKPVLTVTVTVQGNDGAAPTVLGPVNIGKLCPDDDHVRYAMVAGHPQVYRIKQTPVSSVRSALHGVVDR